VSLNVMLCLIIDFATSVCFYVVLSVYLLLDVIYCCCTLLLLTEMD